MGKQSILVLGNTGIEQNVTSDKVRADGWFGEKDGLHTILWQLEDFTGRIFLEASLETDPEENDWFPIQLDGAKSYIEYPLDPINPSVRFSKMGRTCALVVPASFPRKFPKSSKIKRIGLSKVVKIS